MKGTRFGLKSKEESKGILNPNPKIKAWDSPPSPPQDPTPSASEKGSNHHRLSSVCRCWVASDPPKGTTVDRLDSGALPLRRALARPRCGNGLGFCGGEAGHQFCFPEERAHPSDQDLRSLDFGPELVHVGERRRRPRPTSWLVH
jgi:hypothetical protein